MRVIERCAHIDLQGLIHNGVEGFGVKGLPTFLSADYGIVADRLSLKLNALVIEQWPCAGACTILCNKNTCYAN